jgi:hypothetical protein
MKRVRKPRQTVWVLEQLRAAGETGVSQSEFMPGAVYGRLPVPRLSARIAGLRAVGYVIGTAGVRQGDVVYVLLSEPWTSDGAAAGELITTGLVDEAFDEALRTIPGYDVAARRRA